MQQHSAGLYSRKVFSFLLNACKLLPSKTSWSKKAHMATCSLKNLFLLFVSKLGFTLKQASLSAPNSCTGRERMFPLMCRRILFQKTLFNYHVAWKVRYAALVTLILIQCSSAVLSRLHTLYSPQPLRAPALFDKLTQLQTRLVVGHPNPFWVRVCPVLPTHQLLQ